LSSPTTAVMGNRIAAAGMLVAVIATFFTQDVQGGVPVIVAGMLVGGVAGFAGARMVKMTAMPQMVALFNGAGGGAAALVSILELMRGLAGSGVTAGETISSMLGLMIGAVSFSGSAVAFGKLQGLITPKAFKYSGQQIVTSVLFGGMVVLSLLLMASVAGWVAVPQLAVMAAVAGRALLF